MKKILEKTQLLLESNEEYSKMSKVYHFYVDGHVSQKIVEFLSSNNIVQGVIK